MKPILLLLICCITCGLAFGQINNTKLQGNNFPDQSQAKKKTEIRLYPNPSYGKISVTVNTSSESIHFYIFDLEGTLIYQAILSDKEKKYIDNLKKGSYMYDVFEKDQSIEEGKIIIK